MDLDAKFRSMFQLHYNEVLAYCARRGIRSEADDATADVSTKSIGRPLDRGCTASPVG